MRTEKVAALVSFAYLLFGNMAFAAQIVGGAIGNGADANPATFHFDSGNQDFQMMKSDETPITQSEVASEYGTTIQLLNNGEDHVVKLVLNVMGADLSGSNWSNPAFPLQGSVAIDPSSGRIKFATPLWQSATIIDTGPSNNKTPCIALNNSGNAICVFIKTEGTSDRIYANEYISGSGWQGTVDIDYQPATPVDTTIGKIPKVVMNDTGQAYAMFYQEIIYIPAIPNEDDYYVNQYISGMGWQGITAIKEDVGTTQHRLDLQINSIGKVFSVCKANISSGIFAKEYIPGYGWQSENTIDAGTGFNADSPKIAVNDDSKSICVFQQSDGAGDRIYANEYVPVLGWQGAVLIDTGGNTAANPQIAINSDGKGVCVFRQSDGAGDRIYANEYIPGSGWQGAALIDAGGNTAANPQIAMDSNGKSICVFQQSDGAGDRIYANEYIPGLGWQGAVLIDAGGNTAANPQIAMNSDGKGICVFQQSDGAVDRIYANEQVSGLGWQGAVLIDAGVNPGANPSVAFNDYGQAFSAFSQSDGSNIRIYTNKYLDDVPHGTVQGNYYKSLIVSLVTPQYGLAGKLVHVTIFGNNFEQTTAVRLSRIGYTDITASNLVVGNKNRLTCDFNLTGATPGFYDVLVIKSSVSASLIKGFLIQNQVSQPIQWTIEDIGQAGFPSTTGNSRGINIGDGDNDGLQEVFSAGLLPKLLKYESQGSSWSISPLPEGPIGEYYTDVVVCDGDNNGNQEVYGATNNNLVFSFSGSNWNKANVSGDLGSKVHSISRGVAPTSEGRIVIYAACENGYIYQFVKDDNWLQTDIGSGGGEMYALTVGDGNNDGEMEVYGANEDTNVYQFKYNGSDWETTIVGTGGGAMISVALGDGNNDQENEVYGTSQDGNLYQFKWSSGFYWNKGAISTLNANALVVSDGNNNGSNEIYCASSDGHVYQVQHQNDQWTKNDLGTSSVPLYNLTAGDGNNNFQIDIYAIGENNHIYQFRAGPIPPTPIPDFQGQIISKNYIYAAPNPVRGHIANIVIFTNQPAEVSAKLFTTTNKEVLSFRKNYSQGQHTERINVSNLANGVYLLLVKAKNSEGLEEKVVKKIAVVK